MNNYSDLRAEFLKWLTQDSISQDRRTKNYNQAIFDLEEKWQVFNHTDLKRHQAQGVLF